MAQTLKPRPTGSYALLLYLPSRRKIAVGKLGLIDLPRGHYVYFGSALGGLEARVARHFRPEKKLHWHADYLSADAPWSQAWLMPDGLRWECIWAPDAAATVGVTNFVPGFGSSDCRCKSHLVRVSSAKLVRALLLGLSPSPKRRRIQAAS